MTNLDKVFSLNISPGMDDALSKRAARDGAKRSEVVRAAIEAYLVRPPEPNGTQWVCPHG